jgi:hypothetical protein
VGQHRHRLRHGWADNAPGAELRVLDTWCTLTLAGQGADALALADNPPAYRVEKGAIARHNLKYTDGDRLQQMLDVLTGASELDG